MFRSILLQFFPLSESGKTGLWDRFFVRAGRVASIRFGWGVCFWLTNLKSEEGEVCRSMTDEVMPVPARGSGKPPSALTLVIPKPLEPFLEGGVVRGETTLAQAEDAIGCGVSVAGQLLHVVVRTSPLTRTEVNQAPTPIFSLMREPFLAP